MCNHPRTTNDWGTLGCPYARQGYNDAEAGRPKMTSNPNLGLEASAALCYDRGYDMFAADRRAGAALFKSLRASDASDS